MSSHSRRKASGAMAQKRRNLTYSDLVEKLSKIGIEDTEVNIRNKIARGGFTAVFFVQCLEAVGVKELRL